MNDREKWWERVTDIRSSGTTWWWWWWLVSIKLIVNNLRTFLINFRTLIVNMTHIYICFKFWFLVFCHLTDFRLTLRFTYFCFLYLVCFELLFEKGQRLVNSVFRINVWIIFWLLWSPKGWVLRKRLFASSLRSCWKESDSTINNVKYWQRNRL